MSIFQAADLNVDLSRNFQDMWHLVGNTPIMELRYTFNGNHCKIFVKCEYYDLTGSIKDRMALYILYQAYKKNKINPEDTIIEATSGNTGIAFAAIGKALDHQVKIIMPDWLSKERIDIIKSLGAEVVLISKLEGGFSGSIKLSEELAARGGVFLPKQFENRYNAEAHECTTGKEILRQLTSKGTIPDAFVAGVGTGGTVMGFGAYLKMLNPRIKIHPLVPAESPRLTTGYKIGSHRIQGISDEFIPSIIKLNQLDGVIQANDGDAVLMAQKLSKQLGLAVGISSRANVIGAIKIAEKLGPKAAVVTLLCDSNKKYLSTDWVKEEPEMPGYYSVQTDFTGYQAIGRLNEPVIITK